jgi:hypothetical protein
MSDLIEKCARLIAVELGDDYDAAFDDRAQQRVCQSPGGGYRDINLPQKGDYIDAAIRVLTLLAKPESISDLMVEAALVTDGLLLDRSSKPGSVRKAIAAAITAALQDNTEEKKTS